MAKAEDTTDWEDILGTGSVLKQVLKAGHREEQDMEAPRKFFALIDIETKCDGKVVESDSHTNILISSEADIFPGPHLVIPLMDIDEKSRYLFDSKFCYGERGNLPEVTPNSKLECVITLKVRGGYEDFLSELTPGERVKLAHMKRDRGKFWYSREDYHNAITIYQSLVELCQLDDQDEAKSKAAE